MTHHKMTTLILALFTAGLAGCASLPQWSGITADSPANPSAHAAPYTPPMNPFASALAPSSGMNDKERKHDGMTPEMQGMPRMYGMMKNKGNMKPKMMKNNSMKPSMMKHGGKQPDKKNGGTP